MNEKMTLEVTSERNIALCYIRSKFGKANETNSLEQQRATIKIICEQNGWMPQWYEDIDLPPVTRPMGVRVEFVLQTQREADSLSCCADDEDCTPDAIVR